MLMHGVIKYEDFLHPSLDKNFINTHYIDSYKLEDKPLRKQETKSSLDHLTNVKSRI